MTRRLSRTAHWFGHEFLLLSVPKNQSAALIRTCRLSGCATIGWVMRTGLSGTPAGYPGSVALLAGVFVLAVLVGNIVKEIAVAGCGHLSNWLGRSFRRTGMTLGGTVFREHRRADGTWRRYERQPMAIVCEWTNSHGDCHKRVFRRVLCWPPSSSARMPHGKEARTG